MIWFAWSWFVAGLLLLFFAPPALTLGILFKKQNWIYWWANWGARNWLRLSGVKVNVIGREHIDPNQTYVFVANHWSYLDAAPLFAFTGRRMGMIAKKELLNAPILGYGMGFVNVIAIDRSNKDRAVQSLSVATERLRATLGFSAERPELRVKSLAATPEVPPPIDSLLEKALAARPDLRAAEMAIAVATKRAKWERSRILLLSAQLSSKEVGTNGVLTGPGVGVELPVFSHNQGLVARAEAEVELASRQYVALKQRVALEVAETRAQLVQALDALKAVREQVLPPLQRAVALAEEQYQKGDVAYLFVLEQNRGLVDAQLRVVDSEAAIRRAQAQLERSVGSRF